MCSASLCNEIPLKEFGNDFYTFLWCGDHSYFTFKLQNKTPNIWKSDLFSYKNKIWVNSGIFNRKWAALILEHTRCSKHFKCSCSLAEWKTDLHLDVFDQLWNTQNVKSMNWTSQGWSFIVHGGTVTRIFQNTSTRCIFGCRASACDFRPLLKSTLVKFLPADVIQSDSLEGLTEVWQQDIVSNDIDQSSL